MKLIDLKQEHTVLLDRADNIISASELGARALTLSETQELKSVMAKAEDYASQIKAIESRNIRPSGGGWPGFTSRSVGSPRAASGSIATVGVQQVREPAVTFTAEYADAFFGYLGSNGQNMDAALYEGSSSLGGYAVPITVEGTIVPLAPTDTGVRSVAMVIPTAHDVKIPIATSISTAAAKAESGGSTNTFTESDPALGQFTLSAFMAGLTHTLSWELCQDVPLFQSFAIGDMLLAQSLYEENLYVNGTGSGQAQGLIGNVGTGVTGEVADGSGNLLSIAATFDVLASLKGAYHNNAGFLMQRATGVALRKAQQQSNLYAPVFTRVDGQDYLHGYPVTYSTAMPAIAAGATPVLFGDFQQGYIIGDRGGSGINIKILDQPLATSGQIILLAYRRTDGRVRRSEAIQGITLHS